MTIGILGSGTVGVTLANGLRAEGHDVKLANRTGHSADGWDGETGTFADIAAWCETAVLSVKGSVAVEAVTSLAAPLAGKLVLDTTNPLSDRPATDGVLSFFTPSDNSLMEQLQAAAPDAKFVKAFNSVGAGVMVHPDFGGTVPTMFIAGNDGAARASARQLVEALGWEAADMGTAVAARAIEPLCILWCIPGFREQRWSHAFKLLRTEH